MALQRIQLFAGQHSSHVVCSDRIIVHTGIPVSACFSQDVCVGLCIIAGPVGVAISSEAFRASPVHRFSPVHSLLTERFRGVTHADIASVAVDNMF